MISSLIISLRMLLTCDVIWGRFLRLAGCCSARHFCCDGPEKDEDQQQSLQDLACVGGFYWCWLSYVMCNQSFETHLETSGIVFKLSRALLNDRSVRFTISSEFLWEYIKEFSTMHYYWNCCHKVSQVSLVVPLGLHKVDLRIVVLTSDFFTCIWYQFFENFPYVQDSVTCRLWRENTFISFRHD